MFETHTISLLIYLASVVVILGVMLGSCFLGPSKKNPTKSLPYESGIRATGTARVKFSAHFYLVAMFFVVFDLESVFLYAWSSSVRELGFPGLIQVSIFVFILLVALLYLFRTGGLDIGPKLRKPSL